METAKLIKVDRNGSKHFEGYQKCDRCGGSGIYYWGAVINGCPQYAGTCFKCGGSRYILKKWIERTPEYEEKLRQRREARQEAKRQEREAEWAARRAQEQAREEQKELERKQREEKLAQLRSISQYVGEIGERISLKLTAVFVSEFETPSYSGFGTDLMHIYVFKDENENKLAWKTTSYIPDFNPDVTFNVKATIKAHSEYKCEKQTVLSRCKVVKES